LCVIFFSSYTYIFDWMVRFSKMFFTLQSRARENKQALSVCIYTPERFLNRFLYIHYLLR
jgi:hypothetical protein